MSEFVIPELPEWLAWCECEHCQTERFSTVTCQGEDGPALHVTGVCGGCGAAWWGEWWHDDGADDQEAIEERRHRA